MWFDGVQLFFLLAAVIGASLVWEVELFQTRVAPTLLSIAIATGAASVLLVNAAPDVALALCVPAYLCTFGGLVQAVRETIPKSPN
jgi:hypothetical protein